MSHNLRFALAAVLVGMMTVTTWSQQIHSAAPVPAGGNQGTGGNVAGTAGANGVFTPGASAPAQAAMPGQSGTISDFGPAAMQQGQFFPNGQRTIGPTAGAGQFTTSGQFFPGGQFFSPNQIGAGAQFGVGGFGGSRFAAGPLNAGAAITPGGAATARFNQIF